VTLLRIVSALALLSGLGFAAPARAADEVRLATQPIPHYAPIFVAKQKHWIDEELAKVKPGIEVKWASFAAGPPINESFAAGQQDFGFLGDTPALIGKSVGIDTRVVGLSSSGPKSLAVVVGAGSPIASAKDLKGKKVAVTKGSFAQHLLALVLESGGLTFADIELINLPNGEIAPAIISGTIDAGAVWEPVITRFESQKAIRVLADGTGLKKGILVIIAASDFLKAKRDQAEAVLRAYARGAAYIKSNPKEAAALISTDTNLPPDLLVQVFDKLDYTPAFSDDDIRELKKSEAYSRSIGLIKAPVDIDSWVDRTVAPAGAAK
jgi:sulfonate transport system substrate-binding protein